MKTFASAALACLLVACISVNEPFEESTWRKEVLQEDPAMLRAPHFRDGKYFAPWLPMQERGFGSYLVLRLFGRSAAYTEEEENNLPDVLPDTWERLKRTDGDLILWVGHATFLIRLKGEYWLTDPMFSDRALLPRRKTPPAFPLKDLGLLDGPLNVVISHDHYDHLDEASVKAMPAGTRFYVPLGLGRLVREFGAQNVMELDWWQEATTAAGTKLTALPIQHWSRRIGEGKNSALWASYLIDGGGMKIYFGGDSGYFIGFREFGKLYPGIDYALLPVTAYHPRWFMHYAHMNVPEAIDAFHDLGARYFIPTQWGTFHLGEEPAGYAGLDLRREIAGQKLDPSRFVIMNIGEIREIK
jgi:L-ascorbate metabolism protein UlaG (beta-lactamase superfamily)